MDEPEAKKKAESNSREKEGEEQSKSHEGSEGFGLVDSAKLGKPHMGLIFNLDVYLDFSFHQMKTWFPFF